MSSPKNIWPAIRARNFVAIMEQHGHILKPRYLHHWTRDTALNAMADYLGVSRAAFEQMHPIDFMARVNQYGYCPHVGLGVAWPSLDRLLPRDVICRYRGPASSSSSSASWLWDNEEMMSRLNMDATERVQQKLVRAAGF